MKVQYAIGKPNFIAFAIFLCPFEMATERELGRISPGDKAVFTSATTEFAVLGLILESKVRVKLARVAGWS